MLSRNYTDENASAFAEVRQKEAFGKLHRYISCAARLKASVRGRAIQCYTLNLFPLQLPHLWPGVSISTL